MRRKSTRKVIWSPLSLRDVHDLGRYLVRKVSIAKAEVVITSVLMAGNVLWEQPRLWRIRDDLHPGLRLALVKPYVICYIIENGAVQIVRALHDAQDIVAALSEGPFSNNTL